jgi:hypothetical protein
MEKNQSRAFPLSLLVPAAKRATTATSRSQRDMEEEVVACQTLRKKNTNDGKTYSSHRLDFEQVFIFDFEE